MKDLHELLRLKELVEAKMEAMKVLQKEIHELVEKAQEVSARIKTTQDGRSIKIQTKTSQRNKRKIG